MFCGATGFLNFSPMEGMQMVLLEFSNSPFDKGDSLSQYVN